MCFICVITQDEKMEDQCSPLSWPYYYQDEGIEELKHYLLHTTLELETTILSAQEELARKDDELVHIKSLLNKITQERDDAVAKCQTVMLEKLLLKQQLQQQHQIEAAPSSGTTSIDGESRRGESNNIVHSSSDCDDENFVASPGKDHLLVDVTEKMVLKKPLPEKGKFLQAVMEAGPLLQTLLLAGPLPQWQHPPPQLNTIDIPPVTISSPTPPQLLHHQDSCLSTNGYFSKKRTLENPVVLEPRVFENGEESDFSPNSKYQRVVHQSSLTNMI